MRTPLPGGAFVMKVDPTTSGMPTWREMPSNVINLNRFRKKKQRETKAKQAETNRIRHGRTQAEKDRERAERQRAQRAIEGKRLEGAPESPSMPPAVASEERDPPSR